MYAVFYFVDLYFTLVLQYGPGKSGTNIIFYLPGLAGMAILLHIFALLLTSTSQSGPILLFSSSTSG